MPGFGFSLLYAILLNPRTHHEIGTIINPIGR